MAILSDTDRGKIFSGIMRYVSRDALGYPCSGFERSDFRTAIDETDAWIDANSGNTSSNIGYNSALSDPFKSSAGIALKTLVFFAVAAMRISPSFARKIFGSLN